MLVESGAIEAVAARLNEKDVKLLTNYFVILRNLSDAEADFVSTVIFSLLSLPLIISLNRDVIII